jgi:arabinogalactan oligomer/maltooligosaccharide transport system substrate-binding protein
VSVSGFFLTKHGPNRAIAEDLIADYVTRPDVVRAVVRDLASPTATRYATQPDSDVTAFQHAADGGDLMPAFDHMEVVWDLLGQAQAAAISGGDPATIAQHLREAITSGYEYGRGP